MESLTEFLGFNSRNTEEIHQILSLLFLDQMLFVQRSGFNFFGNFVGIFMAHLEFLEHLVHVPL